jgi:hypothetical protein
MQHRGAAKEGVSSNTGESWENYAK